jgi:hypothetical protein
MERYQQEHGGGWDEENEEKVRKQSSNTVPTSMSKK